MRYLVTGVGGFAGTHLAACLLEAGHTVLGLMRERRSYPGLRSLVERYPAFDVDGLSCADVVDLDAVRRVIAEAQPDGVFHLAGIAFVPHAEADPRRALVVNAIGTRHVLAAVHGEAPKCRVVVVGSADVYGAAAADGTPIDEHCALRPVSAYGISKAAADMTAFQQWWDTDLPVVRARPFNHTGPGQSADFVCSDFARQVVRIERGVARPSLSVGNLGSARDFSDVRDIVRGYLLLMERGEPGEAYNLCRGEALTVRSIVDLLRGEISVPFEVVEEGARVRRREIPRIVGSPARARALGWEPRVPFRRTLRDLLDYWRSVDG